MLKFSLTLLQDSVSSGQLVFFLLQFSHWISGKYLSQVFVLSKLRTWALPPRQEICVAGLQTGNMAAAGEGRWPNVKEQYELQEVIGAIFMLYYAKTLALHLRYYFPPRLWSYGRRSSCTVYSS